MKDMKWYALYTNPRAEKKVAASLTLHGYENYLPLQVTLKQWSDRKKKVEEPLFKSYLFVKTELSREYYPILAIPGVVKFVRIGPQIVPIRDEVIDAVKISLMHYSEIELKPITLALNKEVEIIAGPLKGARGLVVEQSNGQYFAINIEQLGTSMQVKVPAACLHVIN